MFTPPDGMHRDELLLAPYAMHSAASKGRRHPEPATESGYRPVFQRDRERVVHSRSFRRLTTKMQVLAAQTNDHHRTRLTHTLEVAQVSRSIARMLGLHEDLTEAVALSHDLGHPPFGHAGERALNACCADLGGFDHNLHALHIVDDLENPYPRFPGLNLSWEVRSAFAYHSKQRDHPIVKELTVDGAPLLEFQVADLCDSLAYDCHDLDDALGAKVITQAEIADKEFWRTGVALAEARWPGLDVSQRQPTVVRALFELQVFDLVAETRRRLHEAGIRSVADVRATPNLVGFGPDVLRLTTELEAFLQKSVYRHPLILAMQEDGQKIVRGLYRHFLEKPDDMPAHHVRRLAGNDPARVVTDYLAGMTDRFARIEFRRLCQDGGSE